MTLALAIVLTVLTHVAFVVSRVTIALYGIHLGATPLTVGVLMSLYAFLPMLLAVYVGRLIDRIGDTGRKLHTARSRNDQVATDVKLWTRDALDRVDEKIVEAVLAWRRATFT